MHKHREANKRGAGKGGFAVLWRAGRSCPAMPDRERSAAFARMHVRPQRFLIAVALVIASVAWAASDPLVLTVERSGASNLLFRIKNTSTGFVRLPSDGYAPSGYFIPANTNPAYSIIERPVVSHGFWLTTNWRYVGTNWFWASREDWRRHLQIRTLKPGDTLEITRPWDWPPSLLQTNTNAILSFSLQIPQDWADDYGLFRCSLSVTGFTDRATK
jgi:hypothetical protein